MGALLVVAGHQQPHAIGPLPGPLRAHLGKVVLERRKGSKG